jgi:hypothetical protein
MEKMRQTLELGWAPATLCGTCDKPFFGSSCPNCRRNPDARDRSIEIEVGRDSHWVAVGRPSVSKVAADDLLSAALVDEPTTILLAAKRYRESVESEARVHERSGR